jgi:hypothetical protein
MELIMLTPFEFGRAVKRAQQDPQELANAIGAEAGEPPFVPPVPADPLGVGPRGMTAGAGKAQLLSAPRPMEELFRGNLATPPNQLKSKPKPKKLDIRQNKPIRVIDPNIQTT